jgi:hypothetical protein
MSTIKVIRPHLESVGMDEEAASFGRDGHREGIHQLTPPGTWGARRPPGLVALGVYDYS